GHEVDGPGHAHRVLLRLLGHVGVRDRGAGAFPRVRTGVDRGRAGRASGRDQQDRARGYFTALGPTVVMKNIITTTKTAVRPRQPPINACEALVAPPLSARRYPIAPSTIAATAVGSAMRSPMTGTKARSTAATPACR